MTKSRSYKNILGKLSQTKRENKKKKRYCREVDSFQSSISKLKKNIGKIETSKANLTIDLRSNSSLNQSRTFKERYFDKIKRNYGRSQSNSSSKNE